MAVGTEPSADSHPKVSMELQTLNERFALDHRGGKKSLRAILAASHALVPKQIGAKNKLKKSFG